MARVIASLPLPLSLSLSLFRELFIAHQYTKILPHSEHVSVILTPAGITAIPLVKRPFRRRREQVRIRRKHFYSVITQSMRNECQIR